MPPGVSGKWSKSDRQDRTCFIDPWRFGRRVPGWNAAPCEKAVPMLAARQYAFGARIPVRCNIGFKRPVRRRDTASDAVSTRRIPSPLRGPVSDQGPERDHATPEQAMKPRKPQLRLTPPERHNHEAIRAAPQAVMQKHLEFGVIKGKGAEPYPISEERARCTLSGRSRVAYCCADSPSPALSAPLSCCRGALRPLLLRCTTQRLRIRIIRRRTRGPCRKLFHGHLGR
jgi:hypothetical protein